MGIELSEGSGVDSGVIAVEDIIIFSAMPALGQRCVNPYGSVRRLEVFGIMQPQFVSRIGVLITNLVL